jgi:hypothetical protein
VSIDTDTTQRTEPPSCPAFADGVHDLAEQFLVGDVFASVRIAAALHHFATKALDFIGSHTTEVVVERIAGFELLTVNQQGVGPWQWVAGGFIKIPEQRQTSIHQRRCAVGVVALKSGNEVINELRDCGVLADDDEARRDLDASFIPKLEGLLIVAVERLQRRLQAGREFERIELFAFAAAFFRHVLANVLPEIPEHRHFAAGDVLCHGDARELDDAAFDGVHQ